MSGLLGSAGLLPDRPCAFQTECLTSGREDTLCEWLGPGGAEAAARPCPGPPTAPCCAPRAPGHPSRGPRANSPIMLCAEPRLSCRFSPHPPVTSFRQHGPAECAVGDHVTSGVPERGPGRQGSPICSNSREPLCPGDSKLPGGPSAVCRQRTARHCSNFQVFRETPSRGVSQAGTGVRVCTGVCRVKAAHQSCPRSGKRCEFS